MKRFTQFLIVACTALLSWWQVQIHASLMAVTLLLLSAGVLTAWLTIRSSRYGYVLSALLGVGYHVELVVRFGGKSMDAIQPLLIWSATMAGSGVALLWVTRERKPKPPTYERHAHY